MIKTVNTESEYAALGRDKFESSAIFVRANNRSHIDGMNVLTDNPEVGDMLVLDENHNRHYIRMSTFVAERVSSTWTIIGTVAYVNTQENDVLIVHKNNAGAAYSDCQSWKLTGYTLDGTQRTGTFSIRENADMSKNVDRVFTYTATTISELITQLNTFFAADTAMAAQNWMAQTNTNGEIELTADWTSWNQYAYNTAKTGLSMSWNLFNWLVADSRMLRINGNRGDWGAISNMPRAIAYFKQDLNDTTYNPSSNLTSIKLARPVCLSAYLGTSAYQSDHCALLRSTYGEGEEGWKQFMKSMEVVPTINYGALGAIDKDAKTISYRMAAETRTKQNGTIVSRSPMAKYCTSPAYDCDGIRFGDWQCFSARDLRNVMHGISYGTGAVESDPINKSLHLISSSQISNGSSVWCVRRYGANGGWFSDGGTGFFGNGDMYVGLLCVPCAHLPLYS